MQLTPGAKALTVTFLILVVINYVLKYVAVTLDAALVSSCSIVCKKINAETKLPDKVQ